MRTIIRRRFAFTASLAAISLLAVGCANQTTSYGMQRFGPNRPMVVTVDANLRHTIMIPESEEGRANGWRTCSEAAPDVFSALSASAAAEAGISAPAPSGRRYCAVRCRSPETAATIERTQTINRLRIAVRHVSDIDAGRRQRPGDAGRARAGRCLIELTHHTSRQLGEHHQPPPAPPAQRRSPSARTMGVTMAPRASRTRRPPPTADARAAQRLPSGRHAGRGGRTRRRMVVH